VGSGEPVLHARTGHRVTDNIGYLFININQLEALNFIIPYFSIDNARVIYTKNV